MNENNKKIRMGAVMLAAGSSKRFGSNKLLHILNGMSVFKRSISALRGNYFSKIAVVTNGSGDLDSLLGDGVYQIMNDNPDGGIGSSIAIATQRLRSDVDALLFLLGDQPLVESDDITRLLLKFQEMPNRIVVSSVDGDVRNPIIFPSDFFDELASLRGDKGAREIARNHGNLVIKVNIDPTHLLDVDTPEDVSRIEKQLEK